MDLHAHVPAVDLVIIPPQGYFRHSPQFVPLPGYISSTPVPISPNTLVPVLPSPTPTLSAPMSHLQPQAHCIYNTTLQDNTGNEQVTFQAFLSRQGRKIVPIKPDGNCLFRSLAALLTGDQEDHLMLRNMLVDFELANADFFTPFVITNTLQEHINAVKANYAWGSNTEILAAATLCQIPVYVACDTPPDGCWKVYRPLKRLSFTPFAAGRGWLELSYTNNSHFDAVQPMDNSTILLQPVITQSHSYVNDIL